MNELEKILEDLKVMEIVSPGPSTWNDLWNKLEGWKEFEGTDKDEKDKYVPLVLSGWWGSNDIEKNTRFINLIKYFYSNHPEKRSILIEFIDTNKVWKYWEELPPGNYYERRNKRYDES